MLGESTVRGVWHVAAGLGESTVRGVWCVG